MVSLLLFTALVEQDSCLGVLNQRQMYHNSGSLSGLALDSGVPTEGTRSTPDTPKPETARLNALGVKADSPVLNI